MVWPEVGGVVTAALVPPNAYARMMWAALAPKTVQCAKCGAGPGADCVSKGGYQNSAVGFHAARKAAVAHLSADARVAAFGRLRAEEQARREQVTKRPAPPAADPQVQEARRRTAEAWDRVDAELAEARRDCSQVGFHEPGCRCRWLVSQARKPLSPIRGGNVVQLDAYRKPPTSPGIA